MIFHSPYKQLNRKINTWCKYTERLDTYGCGCVHDCKYCYARGLLNFRGLWHDPSKANLVEIKNRIRLLTPEHIVRIGGMTDCFQPIEKTEMLTYQTIRILNQFRISYLIVTKSDLVADDKYIEIYDKKLAHFQITITSTNDNIDYEKAPAQSERIKAIEKLQGLGYDISLRLSPYFENNIDLNILNSIKCNKVLIEFLKVNHWIKKNFAINYDNYSLKFGGFEHLPLSKKIQLVNNITGFNQVSVGEYVYDHYLYFRDHVNYNKNDCCNLSLTPRVKYTQLNLF